jgi:hypothetical protein
MKTLEEIQKDLKEFNLKRINKENPHVAPVYMPEDIPWNKLVPLKDYVWSVYCKVCQQALIFCKHRPNRHLSAEESQEQKATNKDSEEIYNSGNKKSGDKKRGRKSRLAQDIASELKEKIVQEYKSGNSVNVLASKYAIAPQVVNSYFKSINILRKRGRVKKVLI